MTVAQGTPRTDQHVATAYVVWRDAGEWVKADFCRELERENAALSAQVVELQKENAELANYKFMYESCSK